LDGTERAHSHEQSTRRNRNTTRHKVRNNSRMDAESYKSLAVRDIQRQRTQKHRPSCSHPREEPCQLSHNCFNSAACCAESIVETAGQPLPGPKRFCSVTSAVSTRASCDCTELSRGKDTFTDGLFTAWPARTSPTRCYETSRE
jgi:hypothetical protein